jgi:hypothetical protein
MFHQTLGQTAGLLRSIADMLLINIVIPDHTTLDGRGLTILRTRTDRGEPLHLLVDGAGLKIDGEGEWSGSSLSHRRQTMLAMYRKYRFCLT